MKNILFLYYEVCYFLPCTVDWHKLYLVKEVYQQLRKYNILK